MQRKILDRYYLKTEIEKIVDALAEDRKCSPDLKGGFFDCMVIGDTLEVSSINMGFHENIPLKLFAEYAKGYGFIGECKDCEYYQRLGKNEESWGTCSFMEKTWFSFPFWVKTNKEQYGSISPTQKGCKTFRIKEKK